MISLLLMISGFPVEPEVFETHEIQEAPQEATVALEAPLTSNATGTPMTTKEAVEREFADIPVMVEIAKCESQFVATAKNPTSSATGVFQIMRSIHEKDARSRGMDIATLEGNMDFARVLYERNGTRDWNASRHCWG